MFWFFIFTEEKAMGERRSEFQQNTSVKRKSGGNDEVDHVFLRFGKRGWLLNGYISTTYYVTKTKQQKSGTYNIY